MRYYYGTQQPLLDALGVQASAAYSLRRLSSGATAAVRVRTGSSELDIGFAPNGDLDLAALASFCGSSNGFVTTFYDQSGNSLHATQATTTEQHQIWDASTGLISRFGKPSNKAVNTQVGPIMPAPNISISNGLVSIVSDSSGVTRSLVFSEDGAIKGSNRINHHIPFDGSIFFDFGDATINRVIASSSGRLTGHHLSRYTSGVEQSVDFNGVRLTTKTGNSKTTTLNAPINLYTPLASGNVGYYSEIIFWGNNSVQISAVQLFAEINNYYRIY